MGESHLRNPTAPFSPCTHHGFLIDLEGYLIGRCGAARSSLALKFAAHAPMNFENTPLPSLVVSPRSDDVTAEAAILERLTALPHHTLEALCEARHLPVSRAKAPMIAALRDCDLALLPDGDLNLALI